MKKKEYEQGIIQNLAKIDEQLYKKSLNPKKYNRSVIIGEQSMLNTFIKDIIGFNIDARGDGAITYISIYKKDGKTRHVRNIIKRK